MERLIALPLGLALLGFMYLHYPSIYGASIAPFDLNQWQHTFNSNNDVPQMSVAADEQMRIIPFQGEVPIQDDQGLGPNDQGLGPNDQGLGPNDQGLGPNDQGLGPNDQGLGPNDQAGIPDEGTTQASDIAKYRIRVGFDSITVHNNHETTGGGDGEYMLFAYVQGKGVDLTKLSQFGGNAGLNDVSDGETVQFMPGNFFNVDSDSLTPLTIFTVGKEDDGCGKLPLPGFLQGIANSKILNETRQKGGAIVGGVIGGIYGGNIGASAGAQFGPQLQKLSNELTTKYLLGPISCKLNANDDIGKIVRTYEAPTFGTGPHTDQSDAKDWTIKYRIVATPVR